jgi:MFS transporter, DHA2 family, methylenomycin A resistance protein
MTGSITPTTAPAQGSRRSAVLGAATATMAMLVLDSSVLGVMLPTIRAGLSLSSGQTTAVIAVYLLALGLLLPVGGRLSDRFGAVRVFIVGSLGFMLASAGIAASTSGTALIVWRGTAGVAAALLMPATMALLTAAYPGDERTRAFAIYTGVGQAFAVIAPTIGGLCAQFIGWQCAFLVNIPAGAAAVVLVLWARPDAAPRSTSAERTAPALWTRTLIAATGVLTLLGFAMTIATVYGAVSLQESLQLSPVVSGLALLPLVVPLLAATRWVARNGGRMPPRRLGVAGSIALAVGLAVLATGIASGLLWVSCAGMVPAGVGIALLLGPVSAAAVSAAAPDRRGAAAAVATTGRQLGSVAGVVVFGAVAGAGDAVGFLVAAGAMAVGAACALALGGPVEAISSDDVTGRGEPGERAPRPA